MSQSETIPHISSLSPVKQELLDKYLRGELDGLLAPSSGKDKIPRRLSNEPAPLSFAQQQVWVHSQMSPELPIYNEPFTLHRRGTLNPIALEYSLTEIIRRHEAWRTAFPEVEGRPVQVVSPSVDPIHLPVLDLRRLSREEREAEALRVAAEDAQKPFNLAQGPLLRAKLVRLDEEEYRLYLTLHQIILDGVTAYHVLLPELSTLYDAFEAGKPATLPELPFQYADFASWQRRGATDERFADQLAYWRTKLAGNPPPLDLPTDRPRPPLQTFRGAMYSLHVPKALVEQVRTLSQHEGATLFIGMLAGFYALLHRYTRQEDLSIGSVTASRKSPGVEKLLGYFINPVVLRTSTAGDPTFRELLGRVRNTVLGALSNDVVPFEHLVEELRPPRDLSRNPLFQVMVSLEPPLAPINGWSMTQFDVASGYSKFDLYFDMDDREEGIIGPVTYNPDLFDRETIARMVRHWQNLLEAAVIDPSARISSLPIMDAAEKQQLLVQWNDTTTSDHTPWQSITSRFEEQSAISADEIAVADSVATITYQNLNCRANQLARYLTSIGVGTGSLVGVCTQRSLDMIVSLLAVMKAGAAYVPLDPAYPSERLSFMITDSGMQALITQQALLPVLPGNVTHLVTLERHQDQIKDQRSENLSAQPAAEDLAYVIYTSGSTGRPKGVEIPHRALMNLLRSMETEPGLGKRDRLLAVTTLSFDIASLELFLPLIVGGQLILADSETARDGHRLARRLDESSANVMQATPATWRMLMEAGWAGNPNLRAWCGGEALGRDLAEQILLRCQALWNLYGPTETTIWSAVSKVESGTGALELGHPIANTELHVLDDHLQPAPLGIVGELHIGGAGLARGYRNQPDLSRAKFVAHPFQPEVGKRLYKTGDRARRRADGRLEFLGRIDNQIKLRGFRIELGEIESVLCEHPALKAVVADLRENSARESQLVAYLVLRGATRPTDGELREFLRRRLPDYMLPTHFVVLDHFPLTPNGKVDRRALPSVSAYSPVRNHQLLLPRSAREQEMTRIWENLLDVSPIGIDQNFFDLGGHSFLASRLTASIERAFGKRLSLADIFRAATVEQICALLDETSVGPEFSGVIPIKREGTRPPLFWIRGGALFLPIARRLGPDQPSLGLHLPSREAQELPPQCSLEDIAGALIARMRQVQPRGPYYLAGLCVNGVVAYEMACQLTAQGQEVAFLAMFDAQNPLCSRDYSPDTHYRVLCQHLRFHVNKIMQLRPGEFHSYLHDRWSGIQRRWRRAFWQFTYKRGFKVTDDLQDLDRIIHPAAEAYRPRPYKGSVAFFQSTEWPNGTYWHLHRGWLPLVAGGLKFYQIQGEHEAIFHEANSEVLAAKLRNCLQAEGLTE